MTKELLLKYFKGETTGAEDAEVLNWVQADPQNLADYESLRRIYDAMICTEPNTERVRMPRFAGWRRRAGIVASLLLCIATGVGLGIGYSSAKEPAISKAAPRSIHVPVGQRAQVMLDDGTEVWLNSNSTLDVVLDNNDGMRRASFSGEAYFNIAKDPEHPFIITTTRRDIRVLGTSFNVKTRGCSGDLSLSLFSGKVSIEDRITGTSTSLRPGEHVTFSDSGHSVTYMAPEDTTVWWRHGILHFDDTSFDMILGNIEDRYGVKVIVNNPGILKCRTTCKFRIEDGFEHIIQVMQRVYPFNYSWDESTRTIVIDS